MRKTYQKLSLNCSLFLIVLFGFSFNAQSQANYGGVGLVLDYDPPGSGNVAVFAVSYRSPADKAKIKRGFRLLQVNGQNVTGQPLEVIGQIIRGPIGSPVQLTLMDLQGMAKTYQLKRTKLKKGSKVNIPAPSQIGKGGLLNTSEMNYLRQKIQGLTNQEQQIQLLRLVRAFKNGEITKKAFMNALKHDF